MAKPRLQIYVDDHCLGCEVAVALSKTVADRFPGIEVSVRQLNHEEGWPDAVVAVPTYLLEGRVLSLGNPDPTWLFDQMEEALGVSA